MSWCGHWDTSFLLPRTPPLTWPAWAMGIASLFVATGRLPGEEGTTVGVVFTGYAGYSSSWFHSLLATGVYQPSSRPLLGPSCLCSQPLWDSVSHGNGLLCVQWKLSAWELSHCSARTVRSIVWGPVQSDQKWRTARWWQPSINEAYSPSEREALCTCAGHVPMLPALLVLQLPHLLAPGPQLLLLFLLLSTLFPFSPSSSSSSRHYAKISYLLPVFIFPFTLIFLTEIQNRSSFKGGLIHYSSFLPLTSLLVDLKYLSRVFDSSLKRSNLIVLSSAAGCATSIVTQINRSICTICMFLGTW